MNILSWAALAVLVYYAFKGWRRGLIMTVFSMFATVIAIALAAQLSPQLSQNWQNTAYFDAVSQRVEASLFKNQDEQEDTDKEHMIDRLPLPRRALQVQSLILRWISVRQSRKYGSRLWRIRSSSICLQRLR